MNYAVPLSVFDRHLRHLRPHQHQEFLDRVRTEIHADLARRLQGPDLATPTGWGRTAFDTHIAHGQLLIYSPYDYEETAERMGAPRPGLASILWPLPGLQKDPQTLRQIIDDRWRYPGDAGKGIFAQSVNSVLAQAPRLVREFRNHD